MPILIGKIKQEIKKLGNKERAKLSQRYFKTGKGEYGEGDIFLGITVPKQRELAKKYYSLDIKQLKKLIDSKIHEERMIALFILINRYKTTNNKKIIFHFYIKNTYRINNWDLVDSSAPKIVGTHLLDKERSILYRLAHSKNLWGRRIAIISTFAFIGRNEFKDALRISKILCRDKHDLIQKAVGWTLREVGKKSLIGKKLEIKFLKENKPLPSILFSYATENFSKREKEKLR